MFFSILVTRATADMRDKYIRCYTLERFPRDYPIAVTARWTHIQSVWISHYVSTWWAGDGWRRAEKRWEIGWEPLRDLNEVISNCRCKCRTCYPVTNLGLTQNPTALLKAHQQLKRATNSKSSGQTSIVAHSNKQPLGHSLLPHRSAMGRISIHVSTLATRAPSERNRAFFAVIHAWKLHLTSRFHVCRTTSPVLQNICTNMLLRVTNTYI